MKYTKQRELFREGEQDGFRLRPPAKRDPAYMQGYRQGKRNRLATGTEYIRAKVTSSKEWTA